MASTRALHVPPLLTRRRPRSTLRGIQAWRFGPDCGAPNMVLGVVADSTARCAHP